MYPEIVRQSFDIKIEYDWNAAYFRIESVQKGFQPPEKADRELLMHIDSDNDKILIKEIVFGSYSAWFIVYGDYRAYVELIGSVNGE